MSNSNHSPQCRTIIYRAMKAAGDKRLRLKSDEEEAEVARQPETSTEQPPALPDRSSQPTVQQASLTLMNLITMLLKLEMTNPTLTME